MEEREERISGSNPYQWKKVSEAAEFLGINSETLKRFVRAGRIPAYRIGPRRDHQFKTADLEAFIESSLDPRSKQ